MDGASPDRDEAEVHLNPRNKQRCHFCVKALVNKPNFKEEKNVSKVKRVCSLCRKPATSTLWPFARIASNSRKRENSAPYTIVSPEITLPSPTIILLLYSSSYMLKFMFLFGVFLWPRTEFQEANFSFQFFLMNTLQIKCPSLFSALTESEGLQACSKLTFYHHQLIVKIAVF